MDEKDGRRSRVPAGTFGGSDPPPVPTPDPSETAASGGAERKRFTSTLTGKDGDANVDELEAELVAPEPAPTRPRTTGNTLVGHPSVPQAPPSGPIAPVLAPPKWRGAKPYLEGEEPQPHFTAIPTPPPVPSTPSVRPAGAGSAPMLRSKVTTKVGQPPAVQPPTAAIDDTIQRMLEGQASVPMQVEEPLDIAAIPEIPVDDLPIEMLADSSPRLPPAMVAAARARAQQSAAAAGATERSAAAARAVGAAPAQPKPRPAPERAADVEFGFASSVAPAEITRRPRKDDSRAGLGVLALAVFTVVFAGGWFLTRGGYSRTQHKPAVVSAPAATAKPSGPSDLAPASAKALTTPEPAPEAEPEADDRELTAAEQSERARPPARRARTGSRTEPSGAQTEEDSADDGSEARGAEGAPPPTPSAPSTLEVQPRVDPADLPDIPSREDVISALEPLRRAIGECVHGMRGVAQLDITVSSTGSVSHAVVGGDFAGTPEGSCIARATRTAQFTPFKKPRFRVIYPFGL